MKIIYCLLKAERQENIHPKSHPTYNERQQKIIEMIDWVLEKYNAAPNMKKINEQIIIDNIIEELNNKRKIAINKKQKTILKDECWSTEKKKILSIISFF